MKDFTMIPNRLLDSPNGLTTAERLVLFCIYRLTIGYQRLSCKISYSKLREMSGVTAIGRVCHTLILKSEIKMDDVAGKAHIITIPEPVTSFTQSRSQPSTSVTTTPNMSSSPLEHEVVGSRGAIDNYIDNSKENDFVIFKSKYPKKKFDETETLDAWRTLTLQEREIAIAVMEYQNNGWADKEVKYIPKASNWLLKRTFDNDDIRKQYEDKLRRKKEKIEQQKYHREAEENAASEEEIKEILSKTLRRKQ